MYVLKYGKSSETKTDHHCHRRRHHVGKGCDPHVDPYPEIYVPAPRKIGYRQLVENEGTLTFNKSNSATTELEVTFSGSHTDDILSRQRCELEGNSATRQLPKQPNL